MINSRPIIQSILLNGSAVDVLRLDLLHEKISGNKWFKLKYNIQSAISSGIDSILTFGGPVSNHIAATAAACKEMGLRSIGVIRGETTTETLKRAEADGMQLYFVSREQYANKGTADFLKQLELKFGKFYLVPEGGNNLNGIKGCTEIVDPLWDYHYIFCACGTAATFAGIAAAAKDSQVVVGISVLKGNNLLPQAAEADLKMFGAGKMIFGNEEGEKKVITQHCILNTFAGAGYAKFEEKHFAFKNNFEKKFNLPLDHIYTTKLFYALNELLAEKKIAADARILVVHSGGLQGNTAFEKRYNLSPIR